jgi:hypothetical protein
MAPSSKVERGEGANYAWMAERNPLMDLPIRNPLLVEREKSHGSFTRVAKIAVELKLIMHQLPATKLEDVRQIEALDMIATKIGRILSGNPKVKDHWDDIAGYAKLGSEACD